MSNPWADWSGLPKSARAVLATLHRREPRPELLEFLNDREWREALYFSDRAQLTLLLRDRLSEAARGAAPEWVRERLDRNAADHLERLRQIEGLYRALAAQLGAADIEFLALKGLTQCKLFGLRPQTRPQSDIDFFCPRDTVARARDAVLALGFEALESMHDLPTDHLPMLIRKTGWEWRGDFFDPKMPIAVEPHFQFWNPKTERLNAPGVEEFWDRRVRRVIAGTEMSVLHPADALGYSALHLLKHVLRGTGTPFHVYELAGFLDLHAGDGGFWDEWRTLHSPELRRLEAVCFRLGAEWFGCHLSSQAQQELDQLPQSTQAWFGDFALEPAKVLYHAAKPEIWLHVSLLHSWRDAVSIVRRRLLPGNLPGPVDAVHIPESQINWRRRLLKWARYAAYVASRFRHHAAALVPTASAGARWWWRTNRLGTQYWTFLAAAVVFNLGLFIFVLLYNLFLLDLGYREDFLGLVNGAARVGGVLGVLPAALLAHRFGLRNCLVATIATTAGIEAARAVIGARLPVAALAFFSGFVFSQWAVVMTPIIAGTVEARQRPAAFSIFCAVMFVTGVLGDWLGGRLAVLMHGTRPVLLLSAAMAAMAVAPALRLRPLGHAPKDARIYPPIRLLLRFLTPFAVWHLATGSFNPFNNVYFARLGFPVQQIGNIFSASQVAQFGAVLFAPMLIRRAGLLTGIVLMMAATALSLGSLAMQARSAAAILGYFAYMSFQFMSAPGLNTLLMNQVDEGQRSGASAVTLLVAFGAQAVAAPGAGALLARFGYGAVLAGAAALTAVAAGMFRWFLR